MSRTCPPVQHQEFKTAGPQDTRPSCTCLECHVSSGSRCKNAEESLKVFVNTGLKWPSVTLKAHNWFFFLIICCQSLEEEFFICSPPFCSLLSALYNKPPLSTSRFSTQGLDCLVSWWIAHWGSIAEPPRSLSSAFVPARKRKTLSDMPQGVFIREESHGCCFCHQGTFYLLPRFEEFELFDSGGAAAGGDQWFIVSTGTFLHL